MRSNRSISLPFSFLVTCCVWFAFLWTMQHAPVSRKAGGEEDLGGARSTGGLANNFATEVVKFFDNQDPREVAEDASPVEPVFDAEMVEYLPLPKLDRKEMAKDLPEVFANLSLTPRNLFRSDVDLDGDRDLDLALLVRVSKQDAVGAVLEYVGNDKFRFAGKFRCRYERAEEFPQCFQVLLTGAGTMHILSHTADVKAASSGPESPQAESPATGDASGPKAREAARGWRRLRLEDGVLADYGTLEDYACPPREPNRREGGRIAGERIPLKAEPVPGTTEDLFRLTGQCNGVPVCQVYRFLGKGKGYSLVDAPAAALCQEEPPAFAAPGAEPRRSR